MKTELESKTYVDLEDGRTKCNLQNKVCYETKTQAKKARKMYELKYSTYYRVYQCDCGYFHLTTIDDKWKKNT